MKKLVKKILISSFVGASFLFSNIAFAQNYVLNVAFIGESECLVNNVKEMFFNSNTSKVDGSYVWGIHVLDNQEDAFLYRFRNIGLDVNNIKKEVISECDVVFMVVDFSRHEKIRERIDDYIGKIRSSIAKANKNDTKIVLICKGLQNEQQWLNILDSIKFIQNVENDADGNFVKRDIFDFLIIKDGVDIRESFFEVEKKLGDLDHLQLKYTNDLPIEVKHSLEIFKLKMENKEHYEKYDKKFEETDKKICEINNELMSIREEFREEIRQVGNDSWKILEKVVSIFSRDGHIDPKGCQEVIEEIRNISTQYVTFQDAYDAFKNDVNKQIVQFQDNINSVSNMVHEYSNATGEALDAMSNRIDTNEQLMDNSLNEIRNAVNETRNVLNEKISEVHQAILNQERHVREIERETTNQVDGVLGRVEALAPIIEDIKVLQGQYEEFRDDINRKVNGMPDDIKTKITAALKIGEGSTSRWSRFWGKSELHEAIKYLKKK